MIEIKMGGTYTVVPAEEDPTCVASGCDLHRSDLINPWLLYAGKRVTVIETGHEYEGHPAVRVTTGPVDWHPQVAVRLTDEQTQALGLPPNVGTTYLLGHVWASDAADTPVVVSDLDDLPWHLMNRVETPQQPSDIIPIACLKDTAVPTEVRRREERLRRVARKQGLRLRKLRGYLPPSVSGPYLLEDPTLRKLVAGSMWYRNGLSLDEIEAALHQRQEAKR